MIRRNPETGAPESTEALVVQTCTKEADKKHLLEKIENLWAGTVPVKQAEELKTILKELARGIV